MPQPEAKFKKAMIAGYEKCFPDGWYCYNNATKRRGVPDLYFSFTDKKSVWVEAKVDDNPLSKIQKVVIDKMRKAGERVIVITLQDSGITAHGTSTLVRFCSSWKDDVRNLGFWNTVSHL